MFRYINRNMNSITAIVVAAGRGTRAGSGIPKQYREIAQKPILHYTIDALLAHKEIDNVICVIHKDDKQLYKNAVSRINNPRLSKPVLGGETRSESVFNGIKAASSEYVLIHDGARPCLPIVALKRLINGLEKYNACFLALPIVDTLWSISENKVQKNISREMIWKAQTPQAFKLNEIYNAYENTNKSLTDDVAIAQSAGIEVTPILGAEENIKITTQNDFGLARQIIGNIMDIRVGNGYDVHALGLGSSVTLNGIEISHTKALLGHSDADVAMHAITDAIFGALSAGDIGQWFPPSEQKWKNASSEIFLRKAVLLCKERGFIINHLDCTIICETPKIEPHAEKMRENISEITKIDIDKVSVKATTTEQLGFTGRNEGIAAQATATLIKK